MRRDASRATGTLPGNLSPGKRRLARHQPGPTLATVRPASVRAGWGYGTLVMRGRPIRVWFGWVSEIEMPGGPVRTKGPTMTNNDAPDFIPKDIELEVHARRWAGLLLREAAMLECLASLRRELAQVFTDDPRALVSDTGSRLRVEFATQLEALDSVM